MGKRKWKKRQQDKQQNGGAEGAADEPQSAEAAAFAEPPVPLLALHSQGKAVAFAFGCSLSVYDLTACKPVKLEAATQPAPLRALAFSPDGALMLAGGDDKRVNVWSTASWRLELSWVAPKKVSAAAFAADGRHVFFADKFGDVLVAAVQPPAQCAQQTQPAQHGAQPRELKAQQQPQPEEREAQQPGKQQQAQSGKQEGQLEAQQAQQQAQQGWQAQQAKQGLQQAQQAQQALHQAQQPQQPQILSTRAELLLGHFCSIVTALAASPNGRFVASADRDAKVRVSVLPPDPLQGADEIQAFCMGHTDFARCCTFAAPGSDLLLLSGGGDGSLRLWEAATGRLLDVYLTSPAAAEYAVRLGDARHTQEPAEAPPGGTQACLVPLAAPGAAADGGGAPAAPGEAGRGAENGASSAVGGGEARPVEEDVEEAVAEVGEAEAEEEEGEAGSWRAALEDLPPAVLALAVSPSGRMVAALIEGEPAVLILALDGAGPRLLLRQRLAVPHVAAPGAATFDAAGRLWVLGGGAGAGRNGLAVALAAPDGGPNAELVACAPEELPPGLQAHVAALSDGVAPCGAKQASHLRKRVFSREEMEGRKRNRRDVRLDAGKAEGTPGAN